VSSPATTLVVLAKEPRPGFAKTRLSPPCTPEEAAAIAEAALADTLATASLARSFDHRVLALDGAPGPWLPDGWIVTPQRPGGLDQRIAGTFTHLRGPAVLIGMDTPQITAALLDEAARALADSEAVLGPASDGGWWLLGLERPDPRAVLGVPMSHPETVEHQRRRLDDLGLRRVELKTLRDIDDLDDACAVAEQIPGSRLAAAVAAVTVSRP